MTVKAKIRRVATRTLNGLVAGRKRPAYSSESPSVMLYGCPGRCPCGSSAGLNILMTVKAKIPRIATRILNGLVAGRQRPAYSSEPPSVMLYGGPGCYPRADSVGTGLLGRWNAVASQRPSVVPSAWSLAGTIEGPRPHRWCAGGLPGSRESQDGASNPGEPPLTFFGSLVVAGSCLSEKRQGRHARGRLLPLKPGAASFPVSGCRRRSLLTDADSCPWFLTLSRTLSLASGTGTGTDAGEGEGEGEGKKQGPRGAPGSEVRWASATPANEQRPPVGVIVGDRGGTLRCSSSSRTHRRWRRPSKDRTPAAPRADRARTGSCRCSHRSSTRRQG